MAIAFLARGGVTLAGGVLPRIHSLLDEAAFRRAFEAKQPMDAVVRTIPTRLVTSGSAVLDRHGRHRREPRAVSRSTTTDGSGSRSGGVVRRVLRQEQERPEASRVARRRVVRDASRSTRATRESAFR